MIPPIKVYDLGNDEWSRPMLKDQRTGEVYVDINLGEGKPDWHTITDWGEPLERLPQDTIFEIIT